ncbi:YrrS family protein [Sporosarcina sp. ITBMC105]
MNEHEDFSRINRKKRHNKSNRFLNIMIGIVVVLILIVGATLITGGKDKGKKDDHASEEVTTDKQTNDSSTDEGAEADDETSRQDEDDETDGTSEDSALEDEEDSAGSTEEEQDTEAGSVTIVPNDDAIIEETVVNTAWEPIGTEQSGAHTSKYDGNSVDWNEKKKAIAYATGIPENELIYWKIKNGGSLQKSIGIVSTKDKQQKYRVYLEWIYGAGWKPVKMDKLTTLDFDY